MTSCAVYGCTNSRRNKNPDIGFHRFPTNTDLCTKWIKNMRLARCYKSSLICSAHFKEELLDRTFLATRLKDGAVPTIHADGSTNQDMACIMEEATSEQNMHLFRASTPPLQTPRSPTKRRMFGMVSEIKNRMKAYKELGKICKKKSFQNKITKWQKGVKKNLDIDMTCAKTAPKRRQSICDSILQTVIPKKTALARSKSLLFTNTDNNNIILQQSASEIVTEPSTNIESVCNTTITGNITDIENTSNGREIVPNLITNKSSNTHVVSVPDQSKSVCNTIADPLSDTISPVQRQSASEIVTDSSTHIQSAPDQREHVSNTITEPPFQTQCFIDRRISEPPEANGQSPDRCQSGSSIVTESSIQILGSSNINTGSTRDVTMKEAANQMQDVKYDPIKVSQSPAAKQDLEQQLDCFKCFKEEIRVKPEQGAYSIQKRLILSEYVIEKLTDQPEKIDVDSELVFFYSDASLNNFCLENSFVDGLINSTLNWVKSEVHRKSHSVCISKLDIYNVLKKLYISRNPAPEVMSLEENGIVSPMQSQNIGANVESLRKSSDTTVDTASTSVFPNITSSMDTEPSMQTVNDPILPPMQAEAPTLLSPFIPYYMTTMASNNSYHHNTISPPTHNTGPSFGATPVSSAPYLNNTATSTETAGESTAFSLAPPPAYSSYNQTSSNVSPQRETIVSPPMWPVAQTVGQLNSMCSQIALEQGKQRPLKPPPYPALNPNYVNLHSGTGVLNPPYNNLHFSLTNCISVVTTSALAHTTITNGSSVTTQPTVTSNHLTNVPPQHMYNNKQPVYSLTNSSRIDPLSREVNIVLPTKQHVEKALNSQKSVVTGKEIFTLPLLQARNGKHPTLSANLNCMDPLRGENIASQITRSQNDNTSTQTTVLARQAVPPNKQILSRPRTTITLGELAMASTTPCLTYLSKQLSASSTWPNLPVHSARSSNSKPESTQRGNSSSEGNNIPVIVRSFPKAGQAPSQSTDRDNQFAYPAPHAHLNPLSNSNSSNKCTDSDFRMEVPVNMARSTAPRNRDYSTLSSRPTVPATQPYMSPHESRMNSSPRAATTASPTTLYIHHPSTKPPDAHQQSVVAKYNQAAFPANNQNPIPTYPNNHNTNHSISCPDVSASAWHGNGGEYAPQLEPIRHSNRVWQPGPPETSPTRNLREHRPPGRITSRRPNAQASSLPVTKPERTGRSTAHSRCEPLRSAPLNHNRPVMDHHGGGYQFPRQPESFFNYYQMPPPPPSYALEQPIQTPQYAHHGSNFYYAHRNSVNPAYQMRNTDFQSQPRQSIPSNQSVPVPPCPTGVQEPAPTQWRLPGNQIKMKKRKREPVSEKRMTRSRSRLECKPRPRLSYANKNIVRHLREDIWLTIHGYDYKSQHSKLK